MANNSCRRVSRFPRRPMVNTLPRKRHSRRRNMMNCCGVLALHRVHSCGVRAEERRRMQKSRSEIPHLGAGFLLIMAHNFIQNMKRRDERDQRQAYVTYIMSCSRFQICTELSLLNEERNTCQYVRGLLAQHVIKPSQ